MHPQHLVSLIDKILVFDTFGDEVLNDASLEYEEMGPEIRRKIFGKDECEHVLLSFFFL
jgi:hypothetical protein